MASGIKDFLTSIGMGHHLGMFHMRGYDDEADIPHLNVSDLQTIGITNPMEIIILLKAAHSYKQRPEYSLFYWLREHGLNHYYEGFVQSGQLLLSDIAQLNLPDEDLYDELEITLPGHQRRLERAVNALRKGHRPEQSEEEREEEEDTMVAEGWWGYPPYLSNAKFPFLCVRAMLQSTGHPECQQVFNFMVDTGSDVCTLRRELIEPLQLESISTVRSVGAHGSVRTTMYQAFIVLGGVKIQVEVIASSYDSVGSQVLRHFSHHIDGIRHKWFRTTNTITPSHATNSQTGVNSQDEASTEAETVPVLPERERGAPCSGTAQEHPGGSGTGGEGGSGDSDTAFEGESATVKGDETDSFLSSSPRKHAASSSAMSWQNNATELSRLLPRHKSPAISSEFCPQEFSSPHKNATKSTWPSSQIRNPADSSWFSSLLKGSTDHPLSASSAAHHHPPSSESFGKPPPVTSAASGRAGYPQESGLQASYPPTPVTLSHSFQPSHQSSSWTGLLGETSPRTGQQTSGHQSGHLMISENGTISLSFSRENKRKREDGESSRPDSDL